MLSVLIFTSDHSEDLLYTREHLLS